MTALIPLTPAALAFGPVFLVMGITSDSPWIAISGALLMSFGNMVVFAMAAKALRRRSETDPTT